MFDFLLYFTSIASLITSVFAVLGNAAVLGKIFAYEPKIKIEGGDAITPSSIENGEI